MRPVILGGGLAGLSLAHFLRCGSTILEKEDKLGGLCRSFDLNGIKYDIGPHILFSKNKEILNKLISLTETNRLRRSNKVLYKGRLVKYPFENDLASLDKNDRDYCLKEFLNNPYETYEAKNMLQFFLKTFGEGITRIYLQPYNEKIWKFDPSYIDTQMVERIPKPPKEDIIKSAEGIETEGYTHQLYFHYPKSNGIEALTQQYKNLVLEKSKIVNPVAIKRINKVSGSWRIETDKGDFDTDVLINCMPLHELFKLIEAPSNVLSALNDLKYNSIYIIVIQVTEDNFGNNFALNIADKEILFHRISKVNFLGDSYCLKNSGSTIMAEVTYREGSYLAALDKEAIIERVLDDFCKLGLIKKENVLDIAFRKFKFAYVIYDLNHRRNADAVLKYLRDVGIRCCGRFAEFEYLNMDSVVERSTKLAGELNKQL